MPANNDPIYTRLSDVQGSPTMSAANASVHDIAGTVGTDIYRVFSADATNGGFVQRVRFKWQGPANVASTACVAKLWITSGSTTTYTAGTSAWLYDEIALPTTSTLTATTITAAYDVPFGFAFPAGYGIVAKLTVAQAAGANYGWVATAIAGKY